MARVNEDVRGCSSIDLVPQLPDEDVHRTITVPVAATPDPLHQLLARDHTAGLERKRMQQPELGGRQLGAAPVDVRLHVARVDQELLDLDRLAPVRRLGADTPTHRCAHPGEYASGEGYDVCICVHAEQNALLAAARFGVAIAGCTMYTTLQPCFGCLKEALQAEVREVCYLQPWQSRFGDVYAALVERLGRERFRRVLIDDPDARWALGRAGEPGPERALGHEDLRP